MGVTSEVCAGLLFRKTRSMAEMIAKTCVLVVRLADVEVDGG